MRFKQIPRRKAGFALLAAPVLVAGALFAFQPPTLDVAPVELAVPALSPNELGQWCVDRQAAGTSGLTSRARAWLVDCITLFGADLNPAPTTSAAASPTPTPKPSTTSAAPTTSPPPPSPTTTVKPSASASTQAPGNGINCMPQPSRCGYPDATNTGVTPGITLANVAGKIILSAGQSLINSQVTGCVQIKGTNVTIRNVRIFQTCSYAAIDLEDATTTGTVIENVEIDMSRMPDPARLNLRAITGSNFTARRIWWHGGSDCVHYNSNVVVEDSYCDLSKVPNNYGNDPHIDGFQSSGGSNVTLRHNTIRNPNDQTSAIINGPDLKVLPAQFSVRIIGNLMSGGGYTVYCNAHYEQGPPAVPTIEFSSNRFSREFYPRGGQYGVMTNCGGVAGAQTNVWDDTNQFVSLG